jgi:EAL domain-containing protein (putative c-di-GMP-specific phosphodiesterase class I)/FixJ family two-component response regulator
MLKAANNKKRILLVDDDRSATDMLTLLLETRGYDVTVASSGEQALQKASSSIDLVLLDIILPDQEGFQVCRKLKENRETRNTSIIILTGKLLTQDIVEGLYLGADDYLTKPFEYEELVARMEAVMRRRSLSSPVNNDLNGAKDIVLELREIIDGELIVPYFQPIFLLTPFELYGFESLSRPQSKTFLKSPGILFKAAIQYGVYQELELIVWKKALKYASEHLHGRKLFLNCNPYLVEGSKFITVKSLFEANHVNIENVFLEITERSAITNFKSFFEDLRIYREHGFKFAVDDIGGGYASLESIIETRPEVVKIDKHIVRNLNTDELRRSIVKFIVSFCKEHKIFCIAEGIETKEDLEMVKSLGVDAGQGYYLHGPVPYINTNRMVIEKIKEY